MELLEAFEVFARRNCQFLPDAAQPCILDGRDMYGDVFAGDTFHYFQEAGVWRRCAGLGVKHVRDSFYRRDSIILSWRDRTVYRKNLCGNKEKAALYCQ